MIKDDNSFDENGMSAHEDLFYFVSRLGRKTFMLKVVGLIVLFVTLVNFLVVAFQAQKYIMVQRDSYSEIDTLPISTSIVCVAFVLLLVAFHEFIYRSALSEFEELSEELQSVRAGQESSSDAADADASWSRQVGPPLSQRDALGLRIVLRDFGRSAGLPLFPRAFAPAIFIGFNLALMTLGLYLIP